MNEVIQFLMGIDPQGKSQTWNSYPSAKTWASSLRLLWKTLPSSLPLHLQALHLSPSHKAWLSHRPGTLLSSEIKYLEEENLHISLGWPENMLPRTPMTTAGKILFLSALTQILGELTAKAPQPFTTKNPQRREFLYPLISLDSLFPALLQLLPWACFVSQI